MRTRSIALGSVMALGSVLGPGSSVMSMNAEAGRLENPGAFPAHAVAGHGVHFFSTAIVHSHEVTPTGAIQRSTETVELTGDLTGRILYQPTSVFNYANGTLVNTGRQVFSGTVVGSSPVVLYDDKFRFDVNLATGATTGKVYLTRWLAGPKVRCELDIIGTGLSPEGNATFTYAGWCSVKEK